CARSYSRYAMDYW
nr:immunoglobulin heavy chain junction region [Mus musculus]